MLRRVSWILLLAIIVLSAGVGMIYVVERERQARTRPKAATPLPTNTSATAELWEYDVRKGDEVTCRMRARRFRQIQEPSTFELFDLEMELRHAEAGTFDLVKSAQAIFDIGTGQLYSESPVEIRLKLPVRGAPPAKHMVIHSAHMH